MSGRSLDDLHKEWLKKRRGYKAAYDALEEEFSIISALIQARERAGLTQEQVAKRMKTTQTVVARLESGRTRPSTRTLERFAEATESRLRIILEPKTARHVTA
ncbi:MAG: helix-turn-helix transcriptional regulator [Alphaproteobacteria bacterium]